MRATPTPTLWPDAHLRTQFLLLVDDSRQESDDRHDVTRRKLASQRTNADKMTQSKILLGAVVAASAPLPQAGDPATVLAKNQFIQFGSRSFRQPLQPGQYPLACSGRLDALDHGRQPQGTRQVPMQ